MSDLSTLSFVIEPLEEGDPALSIVPTVNGIRLTQLIEDFERSHNYEPTGGYAGLVPDHFKFGPLERYFMAESPKDPIEKFGHYLLGCSCGEVGCWPLTARIVVDVNQVIWEGFSQPFRPDRDYSSFGPFVFSLEQYCRTVLELALAFPAT
jgi:hypothetical protein